MSNCALAHTHPLLSIVCFADFPFHYLITYNVRPDQMLSNLRPPEEGLEVRITKTVVVAEGTANGTIMGLANYFGLIIL